ncbi:hypothetical protein ELI48_02325 [Rhizobium ruizarguesonis]|uniref:hypothetical protein n=1 Tax=Rhizobium ruizarguesonis TaxID=2081791 RepID=UPI00102F763F|nr:hypothetical protein [Rhizobium ruizarguesonis]TAU25117.1 hypothetical protein ELI48_02325 [Rhizobium ruizarguesonis]TAW08513.1 hypothetical protein ELI26_02315 [Rhizobium ruizarguesonis]
MTGDDLNAQYGSIIMPDAVVSSVPAAWHPAIHEMLSALEALPTEIRAFLIVTAIGSSPSGQLSVAAASLSALMPIDGMEQFEAIIERAVRRCGGMQ